MNKKICHPSFYTSQEFDKWKPFPYSEGIFEETLKQVLESSNSLMFEGIHIHALAFEDLTEGTDHYLRWDVVNGHTGKIIINKTKIFKDCPKPFKRGETKMNTEFTFPIPSEVGQVVRILDQSFYVMGYGEKPGTVKMFGPFVGRGLDTKLSTRTVTWARFCRERIRLV